MALWIRSLAVAMVALPLVAQEPRVQTFDETIDVRVVNVEAVVTDSAGRKVPGLKAADFRLLVDGREVPIEYFTEVSEGVAADREREPGALPSPAGAGEAVPRSYLVYIDDGFSLANQRNGLLEKLERDLTLLRPGDQMAVLAFDGSHIEVLSKWTGDAKTLSEALARARQRPALGGTMLAHQASLEADPEWVITVSESIDTGDSDNVGGVKFREMPEILGALGKRINPEARTQLGKTAGALAASLRGFEAPPGRKVMLLFSGAWSASLAPRVYGPVVEAANRLGYTVYPVDAAQSEPEQVTLLDAFARATGGRVVISAANDALRQVAADSGSYYWLGFTPSWKADDRTHLMTVAVRRPDLQVRSRSSFSDLSRSTEAALKAESVLYFGGATEDRRLLVQLGEPQRRGRIFEIPVTLGVPVEALALTPQGNGYVADVPLAVSALDVRGGRAELADVRLRVAMPEPPRPGTFARFRTTVQVSNEEQRLVFTIPDLVSGHAIWGETAFKPGGK
jgi:VWFA-related protein